jgi:hypothetical protein
MFSLVCQEGLSRASGSGLVKESTPCGTAGRGPNRGGTQCRAGHRVGRGAFMPGGIHGHMSQRGQCTRDFLRCGRSSSWLTSRNRKKPFFAVQRPRSTLAMSLAVTFPAGRLLSLVRVCRSCDSMAALSFLGQCTRPRARNVGQPSPLFRVGGHLVAVDQPHLSALLSPIALAAPHVIRHTLLSRGGSVRIYPLVHRVPQLGLVVLDHPEIAACPFR